MTHELTGREVYDALREQPQGHPEEYIAGSSAWIDGKVCFDALALRLNEIIVDNMTQQGVLLFMQDPPAPVPPPPPPTAEQTAMRYRLRVYRANDSAAYEKPTNKP